MKPKTRKHLLLGEVIPDHCPEEFKNCEVVYENEWNGYEENGWVIVFKFFEELMVWEYQYCVFAKNNDVQFNPYPITEEQLEKIKEAWEDHSDIII